MRSLLKAKAYSDAVKEKIASELQVAREIQLGILPSDISASIAGSGLEIETFLEPARDVSGDLYEVLKTEDGRVVVVLGDVSGKGIPAALFMAVTMTLVRTLGRQVREPDEIVRRVSDALAEQNPRDMFVTLFARSTIPEKGSCPPRALGTSRPSWFRPAILLPCRFPLQRGLRVWRSG